MVDDQPGKLLSYEAILGPLAENLLKANSGREALEYLLKKGACRPFNLGSGQGHSIRQVVKMVEQVSGCKVPYRTAERRPGDPPVLVAENRAAVEILGWTPTNSSLHQIVESAWLWHSKGQAEKQTGPQLGAKSASG